VLLFVVATLVKLTAMEASFMQPITFKLCRHDTDENWSVDIDGKVHHHALSEILHGLGEYDVVAEQHSDLKREAPTDIGQQPSST
jgi:hypothetical protein